MPGYEQIKAMLPEPTGYAWVITRDYICDSLGIDSAKGCSGKCGLSSPACAVGVSGPSTASQSEVDDAAHGERFRMYDDDGILYYAGKIWVDPRNEDGVEKFGPLADFGTPNAGAVEIRYQNDITGEWETL